MGEALTTYQDDLDCLPSVAVDVPFRDERALRYEALADLLRYPECIPVEAIEFLLTQCPGCAQSGSAHERAIVEAGHLACAWAHNVRCGGSLAAAHAHLIGTPDTMHAAGCAFAKEASHCPGDPRPRAEAIMHEYRAAGYWTHDVQPKPLCPGHISNELGFMAHCLLLVDIGVPALQETADRFFAEHLEPWAMVFGATLASTADHPVLRFAGLTLEQFMLCETQRVNARRVAATPAGA